VDLCICIYVCIFFDPRVGSCKPREVPE